MNAMNATHSVAAPAAYPLQERRQLTAAVHAAMCSKEGHSMDSPTATFMQRMLRSPPMAYRTVEYR
jgi:hypothetical protein